MATEQQNIEYDQEGLAILGNMNRATPGQSLTTSPDEPKAWEQSPEYVNIQEALDYVVGFLIEEKTYVSIVGAIGDGIPISDVVQQILHSGFQNGKWNPDLFLMLVEPLMYILMALCEKAGVKYTLYRGEEEDDEAEDIEGNLKQQSKEIKDLANLIEDKASEGNITSASVPREIVQEIQQAEVPESLMAKPQEQQQTQEPDTGSLLGR
tara:strand:+ start:37 stop:663 length:627 start_codon:yes stop_codon:yes gene_type:complete